MVRWCLATLTEIARDPRPPQLPLLGEIFRACFNHPAHGVTPCTRTFYAAEHVSGKPHVSAFHGGNYRSGWDVDGALSPKAKIFGRPHRRRVSPTFFCYGVSKSRDAQLSSHAPILLNF